MDNSKYVKVINPETGRPYSEDNWVWSPQGIINMHYPEMWGFLVFADGPYEFTLSKDELVKWELRRLYYRQRAYYTANGRFTSDFSLLKGDDEWTIDPKIEVTTSLFQASVLSEDGTYTWNIREDGLIWREEVK